MSLTTISEQRCFDGTQYVLGHESKETGTPMRLAVFLPPQAGSGPVAALWFLSGLTCTEENFTVKAGAQRAAARHGLALVVPDTSPRGAGIAGEDDSYDFGTGAGFYVDATRDPWSRHYRMYSYVTDELQQLVRERFPIDPARQGITGHSMGGHGALTLALRNPDLYRSVSAFAPICAPSRCEWGRKALSGYLGDDQETWKRYDTCELLAAGHRCDHIVVDQGDADPFLDSQLKPLLLEEACRLAGQPLELRRRPGYDHSYFFIASFIDEHIAHHAGRLG